MSEYYRRYRYTAGAGPVAAVVPGVAAVVPGVAAVVPGVAAVATENKPSEPSIKITVLPTEDKKAAVETAKVAAAVTDATKNVSQSKITTYAIKVGILLIMILIVVVIALGSGYIAKFMMKASSCHETMILLVIAGVLTAVVFMGLGYLLLMTETGLKYSLMIKEKLVAEEQYRYYRRQSDMLNL